MASIDHTRIMFKNGKYVPDEGCYFNEDDEFVNPNPFVCNRDGEIYAIVDPFGTLTDIQNDVKWYRSEYDAIYRRAGVDWSWRDILRYRRFYHLWSRIKWDLHIMQKDSYASETGVWKCGGDELYIWHDCKRNSYASFYKTGSDTYIILGGHGHYDNVYAHFMKRGYGDEFEQKMASEAYQWLCEDVLGYIADSIVDYRDWDWDKREELLKELQEKFWIKEE